MTRSETRLRAIFPALFFIAFLLLPARGQQTLNFEAPFMPCWVLEATASRIVASDNESKNIIFLRDNSSLVSLNSADRYQNWTTEISGTISGHPIADNDSVFFITKTRSNSSPDIFYLYSVSQKTGIPNWQKKIDAPGDLKQQTAPSSLLVLTAAGLLSSFSKSDGSINWEKSLTAENPFLEVRDNTQITVQDPTGITEISNLNGANLRQVRISKSSPIPYILNGQTLLVGHATGEVASLDPSSRSVNWKFKTGGSISSLNKVGENVLVTSLDNFVYLFSTRNGNLKWKKRVPDRINIPPVIYNNHAVIASLGGNTVFFIELDEGKIVNRIQLEPENYLSEKPVLQNEALFLQTVRGIHAFSNKGCPGKKSP